MGGGGVSPDNPAYYQELVMYLRDLLHGGHLTQLRADQVEKLENLLDSVMPGWEEMP